MLNIQRCTHWYTETCEIEESNACFTHIVCFSRFSVQGKAAKNWGHQKEHQRRDTGKNSFWIIVYAFTPFQTWHSTRHSTEIPSPRVAFFALFRCTNFVMIWDNRCNTEQMRKQLALYRSFISLILRFVSIMVCRALLKRRSVPGCCYYAYILTEQYNALPSPKISFRRSIRETRRTTWYILGI